jgi:hypothetical protein
MDGHPRRDPEAHIAAWREIHRNAAQVEKLLPTVTELRSVSLH